MAKEIEVRTPTKEEEKRNGYPITHAGTDRASMAEIPQTAIVLASTASIAGLQVDALERRVAGYQIPSDQVDAVTKMLEPPTEGPDDSFQLPE
ncbi:MAG: hypothetical protein QME12_00235 [Nanoarchaeota archaeon]|nr:hypothetical protein [Nanoarchaeota archaeon]